MLTNDLKNLRAAQRREFRAYMAGARDLPFVLERHDGYSVDEVICPTLAGQLRRALRYIAMLVARVAPSCFLKSILYRLVGVTVGRNVCFTPGVLIDPIFPELVTLEDGCCLGMGCRLFTHEYTATHFRLGPIRIGSGAVVGAYSTVNSGVQVGAKATVGGSSFVNRDVADGDTVGGVPAKPLKRKRSWNS
jgi:acetyltransferase-like isoleucine patch superfamily enzyme